MGSSANAFSLLRDQQGKEASTIIALKTAEINKITEKKKKIAENNKKIAEEKMKAKAKKNKKQKESCVRDGQKSLDSIAVNQRYNGQGNTGDGQATQENKAVNHHANENQGKISVKSVLLIKEELCERFLAREKERKKEEAERQERWLAREAERKQCQERLLAREKERKKEEAERQERWLAREAERKQRQEQWLAREAERKQRQERLLAREAERNERLLAREAESKERRLAREEERKKEMARKTLKEYEEQKTYEKQKAKMASLSVPETLLREATLDNIYTKQKSEDETIKKDPNTKKYWKVRKTMNIEEFLKLPTEREGKDGQDGSMGEEYALPDEDDTTVKVKAGSAPDLSEASFPVLGKVTKPLNVF